MILKIIACVVICLSVGFVAQFLTRDSLVTWYPGLEKPLFTPPSWVFALVWTVLYILMGVSVAIVWNEGSHILEVRSALSVFLIQLALNFLWTPIFFGMHSLIGGLIVIILLWLAILLTIAFFAGISRLAAILLFPYLIWVSIAVALNVAIADLNK